jgi:hypothetical protein
LRGGFATGSQICEAWEDDDDDHRLVALTDVRGRAGARGLWLGPNRRSAATMPRLTPIEREQAPAEVRDLYDKDVEGYGEVLNNTKLYAHNVAVLRAIKQLSAGFAEATALPPGLKALIRVRVATLNGCPF